MSDFDSANASPEGQDANAPKEDSLEAKASTGSSSNPSDDTYAGKTKEEIIEMHKNVQRAFTEKAMKLASLEKAALPKDETISPVQIDELAKLFSQPVPQDAPPEVVDAAQQRQNNISNTLKITFMEARSNAAMPDFAEVESEVKELLKEQPYLLLGSPELGVKNAYAIVTRNALEKKIPALINEAEERGKKTVQEKESQKTQAGIISDSGRTAPIPVTITVTPEEKSASLLAQIKTLGERDPRRKQLLREYTLSTLTPAEAKGTPSLNDLVR